jgi:exopolysaccharide biosynthesis polyprenyl glycosylphosphotransferase
MVMEIEMQENVEHDLIHKKAYHGIQDAALAATLTLLPEEQQAERLALRRRRKPSLTTWRLIQMVGDSVLLVTSFTLMTLHNPPVTVKGHSAGPWQMQLTWICCMLLIWGIAARVTHTYDPNAIASRLVSPLRTAFNLLVLAGLWFALSATLEGQGLRIPLQAVLFFLALALPTLSLWRILLAECLHLPRFRRQGVIIGISATGENIAQELHHAPRRSTLEIIGYIAEPTSGSPTGSASLSLPVLGGRSLLRQLIEQQAVDVLVMAQDYKDNPGLVQEAIEATHLGIGLVPALRVYENVSGKIPVEHVGNQWYIALPNENISPLYLCWRKALDLAFCAIGLLVLGLVLPVIALLIHLDSPGPLFHCQERLGKNGRRFRMYKFRSMHVDAESQGHAVWATHNDARVTRIGRFLRATHLDELPQVLNILRGEMSLIGPRPEREEFVAMLEKTIPFYRCRLMVAPGLTGWAQVKYHYTFTGQQAMEKLQYDLYYIKHQSCMLDMLILLRTILEVLTLRGI